LGFPPGATHGREDNLASTPHRILFVEDDEQVRVLLDDVLREEGYDVDSTSTLTEGRALLGSKHYDLLLTDGRLPDGDGFTLAGEATDQGIKVLVYTAYGLDFSDHQRASYPVMGKPVRISDLLIVIRHFLGEDIGRQNSKPALEQDSRPVTNKAVIFDR